MLHYAERTLLHSTIDLTLGGGGATLGRNVAIGRAACEASSANLIWVPAQHL
jgi:hypothetical protein